MGIKASDILRALERQTRDDHVFFAEVKNGPTHMARPGDLCIMDAVAIARSWTKPYITGYEIKISRQDFLRDDKWPRYKQYCNYLWFVCPKGVISKDEVSEDVGLKYYNENGNLYTVKKALFREIEFPKDMIWYLLICRTKSDVHPFYSSEAEMWQDWLEKGADTTELGHRVGEQIGRKIRELQLRIRELEGGDKVRIIIKKYEVIRKVLREMGFDTEDWKYSIGSISNEFENDLRQFMGDLKAAGSAGAYEVQRLREALKYTRSSLDEAQNLLNLITRPKRVTDKAKGICR